MPLDYGMTGYQWTIEQLECNASMLAVHSVLRRTLLESIENVYIYIYSRSGSVSTCIVCLMLDEKGCLTQCVHCSGGTTAWHFVVLLHVCDICIHIYLCIHWWCTARWLCMYPHVVLLVLSSWLPAPCDGTISCTYYSQSSYSVLCAGQAGHLWPELVVQFRLCVTS